MRYDVIIAGAGPVGLFLGCELRLAALSVLVLEPLSDPRSPLKRLPFGLRGLWGPSIEAFYRRGLLPEVSSRAAAKDGPKGTPSPPRPGAMPPSGAERRGPAGHFGGIQFDHANIDSSRFTYRLPGPSDTQLGVEMEPLEDVLAARALPRRRDSARPRRRDLRCKRRGRRRAHWRRGLPRALSRGM